MQSTFKILIKVALFYTFTFIQAVHGILNPVLIVFGTRPEAIKVIPVYRSLQKALIPVVACCTGQHFELVNDVCNIFKMKPDIDLHIMRPGQDLFYLTNAILVNMKEILEKTQPSLVLVQGDTTSAMAAALAAFYLKIPIGHIEAGLRTGNIYGPFPEEINRKLISALATYHFAPTELAQQNLIKENIDPQNIFITGNTIVDALHIIQEEIHKSTIDISQNIKNLIEKAHADGKSIMLLTAHRRESFDGGLDQIFRAIQKALKNHPDLYIIYPMHPNPAIKAVAEKVFLSQCSNIAITQPLSYNDLVYVLENSNFVATDSGGIQEEATSLGKKVIILRNETDRMESVYEGYAYLAGTDEDKINSYIDVIMNSRNSLSQSTVYGDGTASVQIANIIKNKFYNS